MKVYRFVEKEELKLFLEKSTGEIGGLFSNQNSNTFKYKKGVKYLHFFKKKEDCRYAYDLNKKNAENKKFYIATFDIPVKILIKNFGFGYYNKLNVDKLSGYEVYSEIFKRMEFAIPMNEFKPEWLIDYVDYKQYAQENNFEM